MECITTPINALIIIHFEQQKSNTENINSVHYSVANEFGKREKTRTKIDKNVSSRTHLSFLV